MANSNGKQNSIVPSTFSNNQDIAQFTSRGGALSNSDKEAVRKTREEYNRQRLAMEAARQKTRAGLEAAGNIYHHAADTYTDTTANMRANLSKVTDKDHGAYVNAFIEDQCLELQGDLKALERFGINRLADEVDKSCYVPPSEKKGWFGRSS